MSCFASRLHRLRLAAQRVRPRALALLLVLCAASLIAAAERQRDIKRDRRVRQYLTATFPRTKGLLSHLEEHDPETYGRVLDQGLMLVSDREDAALALAREHHPELHALLLQLRTDHQTAYAAALVDLANAEARLRRVRERDPDPQAYQRELERWRVHSVARLELARHALAGGQVSPPALDELLRSAEQNERERIAWQIDGYERKIAELRARLLEDPEQRVLRKVNGLRRKIGKRN